jgi:predicted acyltransferase (DUF342 family)
MKKLILLITSLVIWIFSIQSSHANVTIKNQKIEKVTTMKVVGNTVVVDGDISFQSYTRIPYDIEVEGNITFWDWVTILWNISATGDINAGNDLVVYKKISWDNIFIWNKLVAKYLEAKWNISLNWKATVTGWMYSEGNVEVWSDFTLYGNSQIEWDLKTELDINILWNLYVFWDIRSKERFNFEWGKLKIYGDFRTLKESRVEGRVYIYGTPARRSYYTNKIKYNYVLKSKKYKWFMWKVDPVLQYDLSDIHISYIYSRISDIENNIEIQRKKMSLLPYNYSEQKLEEEIKYLTSMEINLITFIDKYISTHSRDIQEWNIIKFERENKHKEFLYKYVY